MGFNAPFNKVGRFRVQRNGGGTLKGKRVVRYYVHVQANRAFRSNVRQTELEVSQGRRRLLRNVHGPGQRKPTWYVHGNADPTLRGKLRVFARFEFRHPYEVPGGRLLAIKWHFQCQLP